jgi:hypothetical protein
VIAGVQAEEVEHLDLALARHDPKSPWAMALASLIAATTELLIFATMRGEATRMTRNAPC